MSLMDNVNDVLERYDSYIKKVTSITARRLRFKDSTNDADDLVSYARLAAWRAVETYRADQGVKFETYLSRCIANKLYDLRFKRKKTIEDQWVNADLIDIECLTQGYSHTDHDLKNILTTDEYDLVDRLLQGFNFTEIMRDLNRKYKNRREVDRCLQLIRHKLKSEGLSQLA